MSAVQEKLREVLDAVAAEKQQVRERLDSLEAEVARLKDQIGDGDPVTVEQLESLRGQISDIFTPEPPAGEGGRGEPQA